MIAILNTGGANIASIINACARLERDAVLTDSPEVIRNASHVILPGVGAAADSMERIRQAGLLPVIRALEKPLLGICLGMQILFEKSEEGNADCLDVIPGNVEHFPKTIELSVPHMGWNQIRWTNPNSPLARGIPDGSYFYFVHSYIAPASDATVAECEYGVQFPAIVQKNNFFGTQFHPERSTRLGQQLLQNFFELT